ncbi:MAG: molybdopterin-synthase adenylyltransferase MoeB [Akkermansiaceae bacterium]|nr:molybdopterin-synthase adenylyltransferase MoeB [Akkermansiaceae bacterium]NNM29196.1 molybdopterin-synthase adenylyltransferase MoeB [Akkermansiaceae bacterium]
MDFTDREQDRYSRHHCLPGVGTEGQARLKEAAVLCIGAGGLGSPAALYLAAAGVGRLGIVDADAVELSNLQRQILHDEESVGEPKTASAARRLTGLNRDIRIEPHPVRLTAANVMDMFGNYDLVIDGSDNFPTRFLANDAAWLAGKPLVAGAIFQFEGQLTVFDRGRDSPCYRCLLPEPPPPGAVPGCDEAGVLGALPGVIGTLQAMEALKLLLGHGTPLTGRMLHYDATAARFRELELQPDPACPLCGSHPTITAPVDYEAHCSSADALDEIAVADLQAILEADFEGVLLDVRQPEEHAAVRLPGSTLLPLGELPARLDSLPADVPYLVYCKSGQRSASAVALLREAGFSDVRNVRGGITSWIRELGPPPAA